MCLKNKMIAAALCAIVAGIGIFGINNGAASIANANAPQTTSANNSMNVEQLQQIVNSLMQQIQQLIQLIAQLKPQETCGNGICRFGETGASCPADCAAASCASECAVSGEGKCVGAGFFQTCGNYDTDSCMEWSALTSCPSGQICSGGQCTAKAAVCGNHYCESGENPASCPADCAAASCANECSSAGEKRCGGAGFFQTCGNYNTDSCMEWSALTSCPSGQICSGGNCVNTCGNGICENYKGETETTCPADCQNNSCIEEWQPCNPHASLSATGELNAQIAMIHAQLRSATTSEQIAILEPQLQTLQNQKNARKPQQCCAGLFCRIGNDGVSGICIKQNPNLICGDGICGKEENIFSCAVDCNYKDGSQCISFPCVNRPAISQLGEGLNAITCDNTEIIRFVCPDGLLSDLGRYNNSYRLCCDSICDDRMCELGETWANCPADCK